MLIILQVKKVMGEVMDKQVHKVGDEVIREFTNEVRDMVGEYHFGRELIGPKLFHICMFSKILISSFY